MINGFYSKIITFSHFVQICAKTSVASTAPGASRAFACARPTARTSTSRCAQQTSSR